jgi:hypothetical protein
MASTVERPRARQLLFRVFYSTTYTVVFLVLLAYILLTPSDTIYQAYKSRRFVDIFVIAGVYVLTALGAILIYASRLYTNRSVLQGIPKTYVPIEKEDLPTKAVRRMIADALARSAVIAYEAQPRIPRLEDSSSPTASARVSALSAPVHKAPGAELTWGHIAHPGWSSPASPDLPNLQYATVIAELADLIEARAASLAPSDPLATPDPDGTPVPDERVVEILQRPAEMGLREYMGQLIALHVVKDTFLANEFLNLYERARFAPDPLTEVEFRALMSIFAEILRGMTGLDPLILAELEDENGDSMLAEDESEASFSYENGSLGRHGPDDGPPWLVSEGSAPSIPSEYYGNDDYEEHSLHTAPVARSVSRRTGSSRMVSANSGLGLRRTRSAGSTASRGSTRSGGSVIRLAGAGADPPYIIQLSHLRSES